METEHVKWVDTQLRIPAFAVNFAHAENGASANASTCSEGFQASGVINGNKTLTGWKKGNGWQAPSPVWHPNWWGEWIEVDFENVKSIDTIIVYTFPAFVNGRLWRGLKDFQVQYLDERNDWITLETVMNNNRDYHIVHFDEVKSSSIRVWVTRNHYPEEKGFETGFTAIDESPRILEIEAYNLRSQNIIFEVEKHKDVEKGQKGSIAILFDDSFHRAESSIPEVSAFLRSSGYGVTFLDGDEICVPELFNASHFDTYLHLQGKYMPLGFNLYDFLQGGGHLITFGGRAFTGVKQKVDGVWYDLDMDPEVTASTGRYDDCIRPYREQLGIFTIPNSQLKYVQGAKTFSGQHIIKQKMEFDGPIDGWMACGLVGEILPLDESAIYMEESRLPDINQQVREGVNRNKSEELFLWPNQDENLPYLFAHPCARWIPLLKGFDSYGRDRGAIGAMLTHYEGIYRGSNWAFFGAEGVDLLRTDRMLEALTDIISYMQNGLCIHNLEPEYACYRQGESVEFSVIVDNTSKKTHTMELILEILGEDTETYPIFTKTQKIVLQPGCWKRIEEKWHTEVFHSDLYRINATLMTDGQVYDSLENGFVVWNEDVLALGPKVEFKDNYFHFDDVARFVVGARDSGLHLPGQPEENPLGWDYQYRMMRDFGMQVTSPIHMDWYFPGLGWGELDESNPIPEKIIRRIDAQVQLAQKYNLIYEPGLFFCYENQAIKNLKASRIICEAFGKRYTKVPGIIFCLTDDCQKHIPEVFNRWVKECTDALNSFGREYMVTAEFGFREDFPDTLRHGCEDLTFNSGSCFKRTVGDPVYERIVDMRPAGKSFTHGEFTRRIPCGSIEDFYGYLIPPHLNFGMGYAGSLNWKWKTSYHTIWPSDVVYTGTWIPKDHLYVFRDEALFLRQFKPVYKAPELMVVLPSSIWLKYEYAVSRYLLAFLRRLIEMKVDFACIDDNNLDLLTNDTKALIYPIPLEISDEIYNKITAFVQNGGSLFITGDISRLVEDRPLEVSRKERLLQLCGLQWKGYAYAHSAKAHSLFLDNFLPKTIANGETSEINAGSYEARPWIDVELERAKAVVYNSNDKPLVASTSFGAGRVWFTADITPGLPKELLLTFIDEAHVRRNRISPDLPTLHCFRTDTVNGSAYTILNFPWDRSRRDVEIETEAGSVQLVLNELAIGVVHTDHTGSLNALETQGAVSVNGTEMLNTNAHIMMTALDSKDLRNSTVVLIYPVRPGELELKNSSLNVIEVGELADGFWQAYETIDKVNQGTALNFTITPERSTALLLAYRIGDRDHAVSMLQKALIG